MSDKSDTKCSSFAGKTIDKSFEINENRFISVSEFKGKKRIDIREYYDSNGERKPSKKGISLSLEEWHKLMDFLPQIEEEIKAMDDSNIGLQSDPEMTPDLSPKKQKSRKPKVSSDPEQTPDVSPEPQKSRKSKVCLDLDSDSNEGHKKSKKSKSKDN